MKSTEKQMIITNIQDFSHYLIAHDFCVYNHEALERVIMDYFNEENPRQKYNILHKPTQKEYEDFWNTYKNQKIY